MADKGRIIPIQKWMCFALGMGGAFIIALFWMYPALLRLLSRGGGSASSVDYFTWSTPLLFIALLMSAWFLLALLAVLRPDLILKFLPKYLKAGLKAIEDETLPRSANWQFRHGRHFLFSALAGKILIWPAMIFAILPIVAMILGWNGALLPWQGWMMQPLFKIIAMIMGGAFLIALLARLFRPGLLSIFNPQPRNSDGVNSVSAWPFIGGVGCAIMIALIMSIIGILPHESSIPQIVEATHSNPKASDPLTRGERAALRKAEHYVTWNDENFLPADEPICINGVSIFRPKDKGYVGYSLDPESVLYDPYAYKGGAINAEGSVSMNGSRGTGNASDSASDMSTASAASESAVMADEASAREAPSKNSDWIRDLGTPWELGSVYYNGEDKIAGYDFSEGTRVFGAKSHIIREGAETETDVFLMPGECGYGHTLGNGIRRKLLSDYGAGAHLVYPVGANHAFSKIQGVPQDVSDILLEIENIDRAIAERGGPLDQMIKRIDAQGAKDPQKGEPVPPIILVQRWTSAQEAENHRIAEEKLRKAIQGRLKSNSTWVHAGQLIPLCTDPTPACKALRNSLSIYVPRRKEK